MYNGFALAEELGIFIKLSEHRTLSVLYLYLILIRLEVDDFTQIQSGNLYLLAIDDSVVNNEFPTNLDELLIYLWFQG